MISALSPFGASIKVTLPADAGTGTPKATIPIIATKVAGVRTRTISVFFCSIRLPDLERRAAVERWLHELAAIRLRRACRSSCQGALLRELSALAQHNRRCHRPNSP